jgi:nucleoside-diphosphate-sugar epimerase
MNDLHVVFGTGAIGLALVHELNTMSLRVRAVNRSGRADVPEGVEIVAADASDAETAAKAATGAGVVYQCLSPPYHQWARLFPPIQDAAGHARYVSFENTYMYGDTHGVLITEETPLRAQTRKGKVRLVMAEQLRDLAEKGDLDVVTARASDYFGPRGTAQSPLGDLVIGAALAGKPARLIAGPDQPHSYSFTGDVARCLAAIGTREDVAGEIFHVPNALARTTREVIAMISEDLGRTVKISVTPRLLLRAIGLFNPTIAELDEMRYEFTQPFLVDSTKAETRLGLSATPLDDAVSQTVSWFRHRSSAK